MGLLFCGGVQFCSLCWLVAANKLWILNGHLRDRCTFCKQCAFVSWSLEEACKRLPGASCLILSDVGMELDTLRRCDHYQLRLLSSFNSLIIFQTLSFLWHLFRRLWLVPLFLVLLHFPSCGPWAPSQPRSCHDRIPRSRSSGPGAAKVEVAPSVVNLTWTDAVSKYVFMQYAAFINIYIHIHTYNDIVNMLLYFFNICWYLWSIRCWGMCCCIGRVDLSICQKQTCPDWSAVQATSTQPGGSLLA